MSEIQNDSEDVSAGIEFFFINLMHKNFVWNLTSNLVRSTLASPSKIRVNEPANEFHFLYYTSSVDLQLFLRFKGTFAQDFKSTFGILIDQDQDRNLRFFEFFARFVKVHDELFLVESVTAKISLILIFFGFPGNLYYFYSECICTTLLIP
jgi:hypothetical protein